MKLFHSSCTGWECPVENISRRRLFMRLHTIPLTSHVHFKQCLFYSAVLLKIQHARACVHVEITSLNKWHFARTVIDILLIGIQSILRYSVSKGKFPPREVIEFVDAKHMPDKKIKKLIIFSAKIPRHARLFVNFCKQSNLIFTMDGVQINS